MILLPCGILDLGYITVSVAGNIRDVHIQKPLLQWQDACDIHVVADVNKIHINFAEDCKTYISKKYPLALETLILQQSHEAAPITDIMSSGGLKYCGHTMVSVATIM